MGDTAPSLTAADLKAVLLTTTWTAPAMGFGTTPSIWYQTDCKEATTCAVPISNQRTGQFLYTRCTGKIKAFKGWSTYYYDTRFSFWLRCAPCTFNEISNFVVQCMERRGYVNIINYLDDYFVWGPTFNECAVTKNALIVLLGQAS